jgi:Tfp pilus assembly protein PilF
MPIRQRTVVGVLFFAFLVAGFAFAEREGRLVGKIHDAQGNGIPGVIVTVTSPDIPGFKDIETTDKRGMFTVDFDQIDVTYHYRFDKPGYQSVETNQEWHLHGTQLYEFTMSPGQSAMRTSSAPPASTSQEAITAYNAGVTADKAKDYATAAAKFKEAVTQDPKLRQAWESLALAEFRLGHDQETADAGDKAFALGSTDPSVLEARWQAYRNLKDDAKAAQALKDMEKAGQMADEVKKLHNEAVALLQAKDYANAFTKFQQALAVDPSFQPSLAGLAESGLEIGRNAEAEAAAEAILKADPKNARAIRLRYNACLALGDKAKLADALVSLAAVDPDVARNGLLKMAFDAYDKNDMANAKTRFERVLAVDPNYATAHYYVALIDVSEGATADARAHFERFLQLAPNDPEANSAREALKYLKK